MISIASTLEAVKPQTDPPAVESTEVQGCKLGRELGNCPLRERGCGSLYEAMFYVLPPWPIRQFIKDVLPHDPEAVAWLHRLNHVTGGDE